jgi:putative ABC transport system permease protein
MQRLRDLTSDILQARPGKRFPGHRLHAWLDALRLDVVSACRALRHARSYSLWVIGSLALGMAVVTAALALLNALLVRDFPGVSDQNRLVRISLSGSCGPPDCWTPMSSATQYADLRAGLTGLEDLAAYAYADLAAGFPEARAMRGAFASPNYFEVLGTQPFIGRTFDARDEHAAVAVLGHSVWVGHLNADPSIVGRSVRIGETLVEIVGVAPPFFVGVDRRVRPGARNPDIWLPVRLLDQNRPDLSFVGRLRAGVSARQVQAEAETLASGLAAASSDGPAAGGAEVLPVAMVRPQLRSLTVLLVMPIPILVLAIACVNAANLMLARGSQRVWELAIRLAIGAGRGRIIRQLLVESLLLSLVATAIAAPLASWGLGLAASALGVPMPLDRTVLMLAVLTAAATAVAFGLVPALRVTAVPPGTVLGRSTTSGATRRQSFVRRALVVAQVALSLGVLATTWQLVATVRAAGGSGGTPADRLLIARFDLEPLRLTGAEADGFYQRLLHAAARLPGAERAGLAGHTAVWRFGQGPGSASLVVWHPGDAPLDGRVYGGGFVAGDLFDAIGVRVLHGRAFTEGERYGSPRVAVVNQALADRLEGAAVGQVLRVTSRGQDLATAVDVQIVGVVESVREPRHGEGGGAAPRLYVPAPLEPEPALALYLRSRTTAAALARPVRDLVDQLDARVPVLELGSLVQINERSLGPQLWLARAAGVLGIIGLLLATAGLYGVASYAVSMRTREIAIRMAIGADPSRVLGMVLGQAMRLSVAGLLMGGLLAYIVSRVIQAEFHGIDGMDPAAFGGSAAVFLGAMLLASGIPALRAARVDPVAHLKEGVRS